MSRAALAFIVRGATNVHGEESSNPSPLYAHVGEDGRCGAGRGGAGEERERETEIGRNVRHTLFIAGHQRRRGEEAAYGKALALACPDRVL